MMYICIETAIGRICYYVPTFHWPPYSTGAGPHKVGGDSDSLFYDAIVVASFKEAAQKVGNEGVRRALMNGIDSAMKALQDGAGPKVQIRHDP